MFSGLARQGGAPGVPRTCSSDMLKQLSAYSKEPGESGGSAAWRGFNAGQARPGRLLCRASGAQFCCNIAATRVNHGAWGEFNARFLQGIPAFPEGVSQMVYILPERLLALVRPAFDLVLRRIRSIKRCVEA